MEILRKYWRWVLVVLLIVAVPVLYGMKRNADYLRMDREAARSLKGRELSLVAPGAGQPMLLDLGAGTCIPCRAMQPILEGLKGEYEGRVAVQFVDVHEHQDWAQKYRVYLIPTQIFFDAQGKELYRHEGFFSREEILGKFQEFGWLKPA